LAICILSVAYWRAEIADKDLRQSLLSQAVAIAETLDPDLLSAIDTDDQTLRDPALARMESQFRAYRETMPDSRIVTLFHDNGSYRRGPGSTMEDAAETSDPIANEALSAFLDEVVREGKPHVFGPYVGINGIVISAFAPVSEIGRDAPNMIVKLSVGIEGWRSKRIWEAVLAILRVLPIVVVVLLGMWALWYRQGRRTSGTEGLHKVEAYIVGVLGLISTLTVASIFYTNDTRAQVERFSYIAQSQTQRLNATLHMLVGGHLEKLTQYYLSSDDVTLNEFKTFISPMINSNPIAFVGWGPRILSSERDVFAAQIRKEAATPAHAEFALSGDDPDRSEHHPLLFSESVDPSFAIGTDIAAFRSGGEKLSQLFSTTYPVARSAQSGGPVLIAVRSLPKHDKIRFVGPTADHIGPEGLLAIGIDLDRLLRGTLQQADYGGSSIAIDLFELNEGTPPLHVVSTAPQGAEVTALEWQKCVAPLNACAVFPLLVGGNAYALVLRSAENFAGNSLIGAASPVIVFGLLLTVLAVALSLFVIGRREATEEAMRLRAIALKESESRFRTLLSSMNDIVLVLDRDGVHREVIQPKFAASALPEHEIIGRRIEEIDLPAPTKALLKGAIDGVLASGRPTIVDYTLDLKTGQHWFSASISALRDGRGEISGLIGVARDITERKIAELSLKQREAFLRQLMALSAQFGNVRCSGWDAAMQSALSRVGEFCKADRSYFFLFDHVAGTISNTHEWVAPGILPQRENLQGIGVASMANCFDMLRRQQTIVIRDVDALPEDWTTERAIFKAQDISALIIMPVLDKDHLVGFVGFDSVGHTRDWTDEGQLLRVFADILASALARIRADEALRLSETRYREVVNKVREVIFETDREGNWTFLNKAFEDITGFPAEDALGCSVVTFFHEEDQHDALLRFQAMMNGEIDNLRHEARCRTQAGEPRWVELACHVNLNADGEVTGTLGTLIDITERKAASEEIERLAFFDPLTQLPNRRLLMDRLTQAIDRTRETQDHAALLFIDLDNFKILNDTFGHDRGDMLLQIVARRLLASVEECDVVARLGGDEFVVILQGLGPNSEDAQMLAMASAEHIRRALKSPYDLDGHAQHVTPSIGATVFSGSERVVETLLRHADLAMYQAKSAGRNNIKFFAAAMEDTVVTRAGLEADLHGAVERGEIFVHFQPQVDHTGEIIGAEALLRWSHPQRGMVSPAEFIPVAEETGLIIPIGRWVFEQSCAALQRLQATTGRRELTMSVNVSARQFRHTAFVEDLQAIVMKYGISANTLKLELTESLFLQDVDFAVEKMNLLRRNGLRFSLDDFGTGYSSLTYLKRLPFDEIKIDQSFVADITERAQDATIARTIIKMGNALGLSVIAEGVETRGQLASLMEAGCRSYQGYLFGRPQPLAEFEAMLCNRNASPQALLAS
jgi:diguanylate cyclase (GGDEF)-like protein/PAS domain S-box-containing protein